MSNYKVKVTIFNSVKADSYKTVDTDWQKIVSILNNPKEYDKREDMPLLKMATLTGEMTAGGAFRGDETIDEVYGIEGDYDGGEISMEQAAEKAKKMGVNLAFYSTGRSTEQNPRWRVLANLKNPIQPEERQYWVGMLNYVVGGILAPESFTLSQSFFYGKVKGSHYKTLFVDGQPLDTFDGQFDPIYANSEEKPKAAQNPSENINRMSLDEARRMLTFISPNCEYFDWLHVGMALEHEFGDDGFELWDSWSSGATGEDKDGKPMYKPRIMRSKWAGFGVNQKANPITIASAIRLAQANGYKPEVKLERIDPLTDFNIVKGGTQDSFTVNRFGKIEATQENLLKLLANFQLRYDEFKACPMGVFDGKARPLEDSDYTRIQLTAERLNFAKLPTAMVRENVHMVCMNNRFDSAIEWGESLKWDGVSRCENLLHTYFGADDSNYTSAVSMYICSAMGGRLIEPGCKADAAVVLVGEQGEGKTVSIESLAPMEDTFAEINLHSRDADLSRLLRGKLIGELAELKGLRSKEAEDIKAWMSRRTEEWVPKYYEFTQTFKRRLTFWGSTNEDLFLSDVTGNRRWLPVRVKSPKPELIVRDRIQIWAEAIHIYKQYGVLWKTAQELADEVRDQHFDEDPLVDEIREFLRQNSATTQFTSKEIWANTSLREHSLDRSSSARIKRAMDVLKWKHTTIRNGLKVSKGYKRNDV